jgi:uncharacterized circularly permuted ATP-grasp superfamily protein
MADLFDGYRQGPAWDEMFDAQGGVRPALVDVHAVLSQTAPGELQARADTLARAYLDQGVTFDVGGEERPFPLDIVPRVVDADDWDIIERGVRQRVRTLEAFLADVYDAGQVIRDGVVPRALIMSSSHFHRAVAGIHPPGGVRVHVSGIDLVRDTDGRFRVLEDNVRVPSGVSYVMTNRGAMSSVLPEVFAQHRIVPVAEYPRRLLAALRACAPTGVTDPTVVVLTPGVYNGAYFEHALLARTMGIELVEGSDLVCRSGRVMMRTTSGLQQVDVIYRRVDDEFLDPVHFREDSMLGCPGILNVARAGRVTIANAVGNGVADDKLLYTYVPDLIRYYLGEQPVIDNVTTWRLEEPHALEEVLDRLAELVVKPVDGSGGKGIVIGPQADAAELDAARLRLLDDPRGWIAQPLVQLSTVPTLFGERLEPRHVDLRPFAVHDGSDVFVLPGGLTRVALGRGELVVNSSRGGGSKDTWVLAREPRSPSDEPAPGPEASLEPATAGTAGVPVPPAVVVPRGIRPADSRSDQQQQQQQQQGRRHEMPADERSEVSPC